MKKIIVNLGGGYCTERRQALGSQACLQRPQEGGLRHKSERTLTDSIGGDSYGD